MNIWTKEKNISVDGVKQEDSIMMMTTSPASMNVALESRQTAHQVQFKADRKLTEEQFQSEKFSATQMVRSKIPAEQTRMDLRKFHMKQAADAGLLRPILIELAELQSDVPKTNDFIKQTEKIEIENSIHIVDVFAE